MGRGRLAGEGNGTAPTLDRAVGLGWVNGDNTIGATPGHSEEFKDKYQPGTTACIGNMQISAYVLADKVANRAGEIAGCEPY